MGASQSGVFNVQELTDAGVMLVGGRLYTYIQGTTTHKNAYTDAAGLVPHTYTSDGIGGSYIALNARGEVPGSLYLAVGAYDLALKTALGATVWTRRADPIALSVLASDVTATDPTGSSWWTTVQGFINRIVNRLLGQVSFAEYGATGDGIVNDTATCQAALNSGHKRVVGQGGKSYSVTGLTLPDGVSLKLRGGTLVARGAITSVLASGTGCAVSDGTIDSFNTQGASAVNADGAAIGLRMLKKTGLKVRDVTFTRFINGIQMTTDDGAVTCSDLDVAGCTFSGYAWSSANPDNNQIGIYAGSSVTANETLIGNFATGWAEALLTFGIRLRGNKFTGGQYGIALHRASSAAVTGNDISGTSRGISVQVQSRDFTITANTLRNNSSTGIHMASGVRDGVVSGNVVTGTMTNDNAGIQAYYGAQDIVISDNVLDSQFDRYTGGGFSDIRAPDHGIRIGQMTKNIKVTGNTVRGFLKGISAYTTIYPAISAADPNYQRAGLKGIEISNNKVIFDYELLVAAGFRAQFLQSNSYGILVYKLGAWESDALGAWGLSDISLDNNKSYDTFFPQVWQYTADTSGSPASKVWLNSRNNRTVTTVGGGVELYVGGMTGVDVQAVDNSWRDSNYQAWVDFTAVPSGLAVVGAATYPGKYRKNINTVEYNIYVTPTGAGTTASTAGATSFTVPPWTPAESGLCFAANLTTGVGYAVGTSNTASSCVVTPTWAATNGTVLVTGSFRV